MSSVSLGLNSEESFVLTRIPKNVRLLLPKFLVVLTIPKHLLSIEALL